MKVLRTRQRAKNKFGRGGSQMRVRLQKGDDTTLAAVLPASGRILHPESNRGEWAIVALDHPVMCGRSVVEMLWVRPAVAGVQVGASAAIPVHIAAVVGVGQAEGHPVYKLGPLLGQAVCTTEDTAESASPADRPRE